MDRSSWRWFGAAGHFIGAAHCRFHLCTEPRPGILVSSVGAYFPPHYDGKDQMEIGYMRTYETMVFRTTGETCDVAGCMCGLPVIVPHELEMEPANNAAEAQANHFEACERWARALA